MSTASAATLGFDSVPRGEGGRMVRLPTALLSVSGKDRAFIYNSGDFGMGAGGGFCAVRSDFTCTGRAVLRFSSPMQGLKFRSFFAEQGDVAQIRVFAGKKRVDVLTVRKNKAINLSGFDGISKLVFIDKGGRRTTGIAFGSFRYDEPAPPPPAVVPLGAGLPLLASGLAAVALAGRRKRPTAMKEPA